MALTMSTIRCSPFLKTDFNTKTRKVKTRCVITQASRTPYQLADNSYLKFAEKINGRCAMQGFIWGSVREANTGNTVMEQVIQKNTEGGFDIVPESILYFAGIVALITFGTTITTLNPEDKVAENSMKYKPATFTDDAELINGRTAMVGFAILSMFHMMN